MEQLLQSIREDDVCVVEAAVLLVELVVLVAFRALSLHGVLLLTLLARLGSRFVHWYGCVLVAVEYWLCRVIAGLLKI